MPFGLKNAGATYQRMMNKVFRHQIGRVVEVYLDDMIVKSKREEDHLTNLQEVFSEARKNNLRFNPEKCTFGVRAGKFLGFFLTERGIEANPDKCRAVTDMRPPSSKKEIQKLTGMIAALSRFVSKAANRSLPFFKVLKKKAAFQWTAECEHALAELKKILSAQSSSLSGSSTAGNGAAGIASSIGTRPVVVPSRSTSSTVASIAATPLNVEPTEQ